MTALGALALQGCASIVSGQLQAVSVETPGCAAARCELSNDKGKWFVPSTPGSVTIGRSYNNLQVVCSKGTVVGVPFSVASTTKGMAFGNILFGGVIGAGVDVGSGAAYDYPQTISVPLSCAPDAAGSTDRPPAGPAPRLGLRVARAPGTGEPGLIVVDVEPGSEAAKADIRVGDLVMRAGATPLSEPEALASALAGLRAPWVLELVVRREGVETTRRLASQVP